MYILDAPSKKAEDMVYYANSRVPYYMKKFSPCGTLKWEDIPFTTKDMLVKTNDSYLSNDWVDAFNRGELQMGRSSGTTGKITEIYYSEEEHYKSLSELWYYRMKWYGIKPRVNKVFFMYPTAEQQLKKVDDMSEILLSKTFLFSENRILNIFKILKETQPTYAILQPSTIALFYQVWKKHKIKPFTFMKYIEFNGEYLENNIIKKAKEMFAGITCANQYGLQELQSVAYTCPCGHMHLMSNNCYTEIVNKDENGIGDICITTLKNTVMPYIRFITGDKGRMVELDEPCLYCKNPVIEVVRGRNNDLIKRPDGIDLHPYILLQIIEQLTDDIVQYRITQFGYNSFKFELVLVDKSKKYIIEKEIRRFLEEDYLHTKVGLLFEYSDVLMPDRKTGKQTVFICDMGDNL